MASSSWIALRNVLLPFRLGRVVGRTLHRWKGEEAPKVRARATSVIPQPPPALSSLASLDRVVILISSFSGIFTTLYGFYKSYCLIWWELSSYSGFLVMPWLAVFCAFSDRLFYISGFLKHVNPERCSQVIVISLLFKIST